MPAFPWATIKSLISSVTPGSHTHPESDVTGLVAGLAGKAATSHGHAEADVTSLTTDLAAKLPKAGGTMTGDIVLAGNAGANLNPTPLQQVNSLIAAAIAALVNSAPGTLDTLAEIAAALTADEATAATLASTVAGKLASASNLSDLANAVTARTNLGLGTAATTNTGTGAGNTVLGNDARLSDARTPTAHHTSHESGGGDPVALAASQITSGVLAIARLATGTPDGTKFVRDDGTLATPAGGGAVSTDTLFDAKGDLAVGTGADTAAKLTVGANLLDRLVPDSSQSTGLAWVPHLKVKTADETVNNSNALQDDDHLSFAVGSSSTEIWFFECYVVASAATNATDLKFGLTGPTGTTAQWGSLGNNAANLAGFGGGTTATSPIAILTIGGTLSVGSANGSFGVGFGGFVFGGGTSGTVHLQWAQDTAGASNTTLKKGSFLRLTKLAA